MGLRSPWQEPKPGRADGPTFARQETRYHTPPRNMPRFANEQSRQPRSPASPTASRWPGVLDDEVDDAIAWAKILVLGKSARSDHRRRFKSAVGGDAEVYRESDRNIPEGNRKMSIAQRIGRSVADADARAGATTFLRLGNCERAYWHRGSAFARTPRRFLTRAGRVISAGTLSNWSVREGSRPDRRSVHHWCCCSRWRRSSSNI